MSYREARAGAALAGALLLALPLVEVAHGFAAAGPTHLLFASLGLALIAFSSTT